MYKIRFDKDELNNLTSNYLGKYKDKLREEIKGFMSGKADFLFNHTVGSKKKKTFTLKVCDSPPSFTYKFLEECVDAKNTRLDNLLIGDINAQIAIIKDVLNNDPSHFEQLSAQKATKMGYYDGDVVDDFNTIMHEIFVNRSFDGDKCKRKVHALTLDKDDFVKNLKIRICPYCGRAYIYRVEKKGKNGDVFVKPQLDHFLPKSNYPFLGMNFFNLIPCCTQCNLVPCKGDNDPMESSKQKIAYLMHPYDFDEKGIRFIHQLKGPDTYNPDSYDVIVGYKDKDLKKGYNNFLAIDKLYAEHNIEICNMYLKARAFRVVDNGFYKSIGMNGIPIALLTHGILGFNLNNVEERRQLMYKFQKDSVLQIVKPNNSAKTNYFVDWNGKEIIVIA